MDDRQQTLFLGLLYSSKDAHQIDQMRNPVPDIDIGHGDKTRVAVELLDAMSFEPWGH